MMNSQFKTKLLQHLTAKKANKGFTLIELLVVVIIIGLLVAVALPSFLNYADQGSHSEATSQIGAVNRAQQSYYSEHKSFATSETDLQVPLPSKVAGTSKYYEFAFGIGPNAGGILAIANTNQVKDYATDYVGGTSYNTTDRAFATVICRVDENVTGTFTTHLANPGIVNTADTNVTCAGSSKPVH